MHQVRCVEDHNMSIVAAEERRSLGRPTTTTNTNLFPMAQAAKINTADKDLTEWGKAIDEELVEVKTLEEEVFEVIRP
jgi:hypothetical protein